MDGDAASPPARDAARSRVVRRAQAGGWEGVSAQFYEAQAAGAFRGVTRQVLAGGPGSGCAFEVRYFELAPGGRSRRERHRHQHVVMVLRGGGTAWLAGTSHRVAEGDLVHVAPGEAHQFVNDGEAPFGFLCIVDSERDLPVPLDEEGAGAACELPPGGDGPAPQPPYS